MKRRGFYEFARCRVKSVTLLLVALLFTAQAQATDLEGRLDAARADEDRLERLSTWLAEGRAAEVEAELLDHPDRVEGHPRLLNLLGLAIADQGRWPNAIARYEQSIRISPDQSEPHLNLAVALIALGSRGRALAEFDRASALDPRSVDALLGLGRLYMDLRRVPLALEPLERALELAPADPRVLRASAELAETLAESGVGRAEAVGLWERLDAIEPSADTARRRAILLHEDDPERAIELFESCLQRDPAAIDCAESAASLLATGGEPAQVVSLLYPRLLELRESGLLLLLQALETQGDDASIEVVASARPPESGAGWGFVGLSRRRSGDLEGAMEATRNGLELAELDPDLYNLWGVLLSDQDRNAEARAAWHRCLELSPGHTQAAANLRARPKKDR